METAKQFILDENQHFLAVSLGISRGDLLELIRWSAEMNDLVSSEPTAASWNFHPLPSGHYCLSQTFRLGTPELFTHGILVSPQLLCDYANNAIALMKHLNRLGFWQAGMEVTRQLWQKTQDTASSPQNTQTRPNAASSQQNEVPSQPNAASSQQSTQATPNGEKRAASFPSASSGQPSAGSAQNDRPARRTIPVLRSIPVDGGAEAVRLSSLHSVVSHVGVRRFATILDSILNHVTTILEGRLPLERLLEALLDMLPVSCRPEISFSTGLKFSPERPFRLVGIEDSTDEHLRIRSSYHLPLLSTDCENDATSALPAMRHRWAMFVAAVLEQKLEYRWQESATLDTNVSVSDLSKRARRYFRQYGLDVLYQKLSELHHQKSPLDSHAYRVFQMQFPTLEDAKQTTQSTLFQPNESASAASVRPSASSIEAPSGSSSSSSSSPSPVFHQHYVATVSEAMHGNPLASVHLQDTFRSITQSTPEANREEVSDTLLAEGLQQWNAERANASNQSWHQIENVVDTLSEMLTLWGESKGF